MTHGHPQGLQPSVANPDDIKGPSAGGEDAAAALNHQRQVPAFEEGGQFGGKKLLKTLAEKVAVFTEMGEEVGEFSTIAKVAATLAADADLPTGSLHFFQEYDFSTPFGGSTRCHEAGGTAADDDGSTYLHGVRFLVEKRRSSPCKRFANELAIGKTGCKLL